MAFLEIVVSTARMVQLFVRSQVLSVYSAGLCILTDPTRQDLPAFGLTATWRWPSESRRVCDFQRRIDIRVQPASRAIACYFL